MTVRQRQWAELQISHLLSLRFHGATTNGRPSSSSAVDYTNPDILLDEVIHPGEPLHPDPEDPASFCPGTHSPGMGQHPNNLVRGKVLKVFSEPPPSIAERLELRRLRDTKQIEKWSQSMSKGVGDTTVLPLQGQSDSAADLTSWENSLFKFFYVNHITNSAVRAVLATIALTKNAGDWWIAHKSRREILTLSWSQLRELVQVELVPDAAKGLTSAAWADLTFDGNLDNYFLKVRKMSHVYPLPPRELQVMASRPFGSIFVERVRGASAQQGPMGITLPDWETMVKAYVREQETNPNFQSWGRGGLRTSSSFAGTTASSTCNRNSRLERGRR